MDKILLIQNVLEAFIFVVSSIIFALLYGALDKKYYFTNKIFSAFKGIYKWEWIIHVVIAIVLIFIVNYLGSYVLGLSDLLTSGVIGAIVGICMYNSNRYNILE